MSRAPGGAELPGPGARAVAIARASGFRGLLFGVLAATVYRRLVLFELELDGHAAANPLGLELALCDGARLAEYETLRPGQRALAERRLADGQRWVGAWLDGALVSARWIAAGEVPIDYLDLRLPLAAGEVYIHDTYTDPACRGGGIAAAGLRLLYPVLAAEGRSVAVCACLPENRPAWRSIVKAGFRPVGKLGYVGLGPWRREFVRRR